MVTACRGSLSLPRIFIERISRLPPSLLILQIEYLLRQMES
jgi:hypothetical protein